MQEPVHTEKVGSFRIEVHYDTDAESPREWDNLGTIIYSSRRYTLGDINCDIDNHLYGLCTDIHPDFPEEQFEEHGWRILEKYYHILPVYAYIHSGVALSTGRFSCPWDSGQSGFIYCLKEKMMDSIEDYSEERAEEILKSEIETFSKFLNGEVYGFLVIDEETEETVDSCFGYYEDYDGYPLEEARNYARFNQKEKEKLQLETVLAEVWP